MIRSDESFKMSIHHHSTKATTVHRNVTEKKDKSRLIFSSPQCPQSSKAKPSEERTYSPAKLLLAVEAVVVAPLGHVLIALIFHFVSLLYVGKFSSFSSDSRRSCTL